MNVIDFVKAARRVSTPLLAIGTADQPATVNAIVGALNGAPLMKWDALNGVRAINDAGFQALTKIAGESSPDDLAAASTNPRAALDLASKLPKQSVLFFVNAHRFIDDAVVATGIGNLREPYKSDKRTLVLLGAAFTLPAELQHDVLVFDEPLPDSDALRSIVTNLGALVEEQGGKNPLPSDISPAIDAVRGLSSFSAEQVVAMSMSRESLDIGVAWERKKVTINQTRGLSISTDYNAPDVSGLESIMYLCDRLEFGCVLRIDEIEKQMAGMSGDTSGVSQDQNGAILRWMEDRGHTGFIAVGPAGTGKSLVSKAVGARRSKPTLELDLGAVKGSLVGESEQQVRNALKVVDGVAAGRVLVIATCNKIESLPPELRRRFKLGTFFFDLPTAAERKDIWKLYIKKFNLTKTQAAPFATDDEGWTGAEIRNVCELAADLKVTLDEAARYIVPVVKADPAGVEKLRRLANGRFLSASTTSVYSMPNTNKIAATGGREMEV